jgi:hypothetical protein
MPSLVSSLTLRIHTKKPARGSVSDPGPPTTLDPVLVPLTCVPSFCVPSFDCVCWFLWFFVSDFNSCACIYEPIIICLYLRALICGHLLEYFFPVRSFLWSNLTSLVCSLSFALPHSCVRIHLFVWLLSWPNIYVASFVGPHFCAFTWIFVPQLECLVRCPQLPSFVFALINSPHSCLHLIRLSSIIRPSSCDHIRFWSHSCDSIWVPPYVCRYLC